MPAFITHYLFGVDMYHALSDKETKSLLYKYQNAYKLGLQGPDIFFYDLSLILGPSEYKVGNYMHEHKVSKFFQNYINQLSTLNGSEYKCGLAYLCGLLAHYSLDAHVHPYIYYRTGYSPNIEGSNINTFTVHGTLEALIDKQLLFERKGLTPSNFYPSKTIYLTSKELSIIAKLMSSSINKTFHSFLRDTGKTSTITSSTKIKKAINSMKIELLVLHDRTGRKQRSIHAIETFLKQEHIVSSLILNDTLTDTMDAFNLAGSTWHNPWDTSLTTTDTFYDLYSKAAIFYQNILSHISAYLCRISSGLIDYTRLDHLIETIGNRSYHSGLDVGNKD